MKKQKIELKKDSIQQKKMYERPQFKKIKMHADNVLSVCLLEMECNPVSSSSL